MNMKKIIMVLISMALVFTMAGAVSAAGTSYTDGGEATALVKISGDVFDTLVLISFPDEIELTGEYDGFFSGSENITITKAVFGSGYTGVNISVISANLWNLKDSSENEIRYGMGLEKDVDYDEGWIDNAYMSSETILTLTNTVSEDSPYTVEYGFITFERVGAEFAVNNDLTDTLTFTVDYIVAEESTE